MSTDNDMVFGTLVLAVFLAFVFALGYAINRIKNRRFGRAWAPLVPIIDGHVVEDGGGAATSWLVGRYEGRRVAASITPQRNRYSGDDAGDGHRYNHFDVTLSDEPGAADWSVQERAVALGLRGAEWRVESQDIRLAEKLRNAGLIDLALQLGAMSIEYSRSGRTLRLNQDLGPRRVPAPEQFRGALNGLLQLAAIHARCNASASA